MYFEQEHQFATHCTENIPALRNYLNEVERVEATRRLVEHFSIERLAQAVDFEVEQAVNDLGSS